MTKLTYVTTDIHGHLDALTDAFRYIGDDAAESGVDMADVQIILLGDYIDRGPKSREVLDLLLRMQASPTSPARVVPLRGNHDDMMLRALRYRSKEHEDCWLRNGGIETLRNYNVDAGPADGIRPHEMMLDREAIEVHLDFIEHMHFYAEDEKRIYVHAGIVNVGFGHYNMEMQNLDTLLWCRPEEMATHWPGRCDKLVVHGHTPHHAGLPGRTLGLDGGVCFNSGHLKVAKFYDDTRLPVSIKKIFPRQSVPAPANQNAEA